MDLTRAMNILFLRRKKTSDIGGLSRFITELVTRFPPFDWKKSIDLIHATDATLLPFGVLLAFIFRAPLTVTAHGLDLTFDHRLYQLMLKIFLPYADAVVLDSSLARSLLARLKVRNVHVIHPGVSVSHLFSTTTTPFLSPHAIHNPTVLLTVGNLVPRKGHVWFIEHVFTKLPKRFVYHIIGQGKERKNIQKIIKRHNLANRVVLLGRLSNTRLGQAYAKTHIYVAPNVHIPGDFEGFGLAAGEAAALGIPVLVGRVDGLPAVIHDNKNGHLVAPTARAWTSAIMNAQKIPGAARYTRTNFSWEKTIWLYSRLFREVVDKKKSSPKRFFAK